MQRLVLVLTLVLIGVLSQAAHAEVPKGWILSGSDRSNYLTGTEPGDQGAARRAYLKATPQAGVGFGTLTQVIDASNYRGKRVRLSGYLSSDAATSGGFWMRIDGAGSRRLGFDNMENRAVTGTTARQRYQVVLDVPAEATDIAFGFLLVGKGQLWADGLRLETVDSSVPVTSSVTLPAAPTNLDFAD
ncbi:MAG: hypothetical protein ABW154_08860 [Dyella sp.]